jgi:hypothetical protein
MQGDESERDTSLEARIQRAREANLALYLDDPSPESAHFLVIFEQTVLQLIGQKRREDEQRGKGTGA